VFGLIEAPDHGWTSPTTVAAFVLAGVVLLLFVLWELRTPEPMLDMHLFRHPAFSIGSSGMTLVFVAMYGVMFLITQYFQLVLGYSPLEAAAGLLPLAMTLLVVSLTTPKLTARFGAHRVVACGMCLLGIGMLLLSRLTAHTPYAYLVVSFVPFSSGMALAMSPMTASIMSAVPSRRAGMGSAMNDATRELGAALGVAVMGSIAASRYSGHISSALHGLGSADQATARSSIAGALGVAQNLGGSAGEALRTASEGAFLSGVHVSAIAAAGLAFGSAVLVYRKLPHNLARTGAVHGPIESLEDAAELGIAGVPPLFADDDGAPTPSLSVD
jgi:Na+/melibiose symporter-like transporter